MLLEPDLGRVVKLSSLDFRSPHLHLGLASVFLALYLHLLNAHDISLDFGSFKVQFSHNFFQGFDCINFVLNFDLNFHLFLLQWIDLACRLNGNLTLLLNVDECVLPGLLDPRPDCQLLINLLPELLVDNLDLLGVVCDLVTDLL